MIDLKPAVQQLKTHALKDRKRVTIIAAFSVAVMGIGIWNNPDRSDSGIGIQCGWGRHGWGQIWKNPAAENDTFKIDCGDTITNKTDSYYFARTVYGWSATYALMPPHSTSVLPSYRPDDSGLSSRKSNAHLPAFMQQPHRRFVNLWRYQPGEKMELSVLCGEPVKSLGYRFSLSCEEIERGVRKLKVERLEGNGVSLKVQTHESSGHELNPAKFHNNYSIDADTEINITSVDRVANLDLIPILK